MRPFYAATVLAHLDVVIETNDLLRAARPETFLATVLKLRERGVPTVAAIEVTMRAITEREGHHA